MMDTRQAVLAAVVAELGRQARESVDMPYVDDTFPEHCFVLDGNFDIAAITDAAIAAHLKALADAGWKLTPPTGTASTTPETVSTVYAGPQADVLFKARKP